MEEQAVRYDELIFVTDRPDERMAPAVGVRQLSFGDLIERLNREGWLSVFAKGGPPVW